jgi:hypothetical protein
MNAAGATTITVNTGLFAAGDTVFIQNLGAGACTVTAGTATVATAGSLILPQNDAGILYFTSASAAIFYDYIQVGATSPLTTKGDIYVYGTSDTRLGVGTDGHTLVANSSTATGLEWQAPAAAAFSGVRVTKTSQSIPNATETVVTFGTETFDEGGYHSTVTNTGRLTVPSGKAGYYDIYFQLTWDPNATGSRNAYIWLNGTATDIARNNLAGVSGVYLTPTVSTTYYLAEGDFVQVGVYQNSTASLNVDGGTFGMNKVG